MCALFQSGVNMSDFQFVASEWRFWDWRSYNWCLFQALQYLNEITNDQVLTINPTFRLPDGTGLFAQIFVNGLHLNQDLIEKGYAMTKPVSFVYAVQYVHAIWVGLEPYSVFHVIFVLL